MSEIGDVLRRVKRVPGLDINQATKLINDIQRKQIKEKDKEIAELKAEIEIKNNFIAKISFENARAHISKDNIINALKIALKTACEEEGTHPEAYYKE